MEDPINFDLWCRVDKQDWPALREILRELASSSEWSGTLKRAAGQVARGGSVLLLHRARLGDIARQVASLPPSFDCLVVQAGWDPTSPNLERCADHDLLYGGVLGCPACRGFIR